MKLQTRNTLRIHRKRGHKLSVAEVNRQLDKYLEDKTLTWAPLPEWQAGYVCGLADAGIITPQVWQVINHRRWNKQ